ncbi:MAG: lipopolysaccharide transport periplasmic protein LptA [Gammaproteobacteria bacterium]
MSQGRSRLKIFWPLACLVAAATSLAAQEELGISFDRSAPISLDAASSEFDRRNDRLSFTDLTIRQGDVAIDADQAIATRLDFDDSVWMFTGNVVIQSANTRAWSDAAQVRFVNHRLQSARLTGQLAKFEQEQEGKEELTQGRARIMEYDLETNMIRMTDDAWVSDGANEVSGPRIAYDLTREFIIADGDEQGQVRMKIQPSADQDGS